MMAKATIRKAGKGFNPVARAHARFSFVTESGVSSRSSSPRKSAVWDRWDASAHECVLLHGAGELPASPASRWAARWQETGALAQYARKRAALDPVETDPTLIEATVVRVDFTAGGSSRFLGLPSQATVHEWQTELRKNFEDLFASPKGDEAPAPVLFDLSALATELQEPLLIALGVLSETANWSASVFGRRAQSSSAHLAKTPPKVATREFWIISRLTEARARPLVFRGQSLGAANGLVRTLADLPANELTPGNYRNHVQELAKNSGIGFEFWDTRELERRQAGAFLAVTRADPESAGGIVVLRYRPEGFRPAASAGPKRRQKRELALVGKGICFDTGGYNVKTGGSMLGMHGDMTGSALALALCLHFAELKVDFAVTAYLALAENLISPTAFKPNEVVLASNGTSIEVVDTDAEGRMILADALALAARSGPDLCVDFATLTYGSIRALDTRRAAVFSNREELLATAVQVGEQSGERTWGFPIGGDYRRELKSKVADILQCSASNHSDQIYAATFLSHFVGAATPWVHVDLACAENKGGLGLIGSDTTGFGALWADAFVRRVFGLRE